MCKHVQAPVLLGHITQATHLRPTGHNGVEPLSHGTTSCEASGQNSQRLEYIALIFWDSARQKRDGFPGHGVWSRCI